MADNNKRQTEYFALSDLLTRLHPDNPKGHDIGLIITLIKEHGYVETGTIDDRTGLFLAGHGRTEALNMMKKQGMDIPDGIIEENGEWYIPVSVGYRSKNDLMAKAYLAASNKSTIAGGWDEPKLAELLQDIFANEEVKFEATGYSGDDLDELLRDLKLKQTPPEDPGAQVDRAAELQKKWQVQRGDVWELHSEDGKRVHKIMCGDSTDAGDVEMLMGVDSVVALFCTDPPYGVNYGDKTSDGRRGQTVKERAVKQIEGAWGSLNLSEIKNDTDVTTSIDAMRIINQYPLKENWLGYIFCGDELFVALFQLFLETQIKFHQLLVWVKDIPSPSFRFYRHKHELCMLIGDGVTVVGTKSGNERWFGDMNQTTILNFPSIQSAASVDDNNNKKFAGGAKNLTLHPMQKPISMIRYLITNSSLENELICDPFLGSGTTAIAAEMTGRICYGLEIDPTYCAVILQRATAMGLTAQLVTQGKQQ